MIQVVVPSRLDSTEYRAQRDEIELLIARINGRFARPGTTPVEYIHRDISKPALVALYRRADVMMVTALRDGMNLVAQEFVLCQSEPGLPSRWRGRSPPLRARRRGAGPPGRAPRQPLERRRRRRAPRERRSSCRRGSDSGDSRRWRSGSRTSRAGAGPRASSRGSGATRGASAVRADRRPSTRRSRSGSLAGSHARGARTILLDYDGTLREFEVHPDLAQPTPEIRALLRSLAALPDTDVHIVSGRRRRNLEQWFGAAPDPPLRRARLPRARAGRGVADAGRPRSHAGCGRSSGSCGVSPQTFPARTSSGSRAASPGTTARRSPSTGRGARASCSTTSTSTSPARRPRSSQGHQVVEVRALGVDKGVYVRSLFPDGKESTHFVLGLGDDRTDHDLLDALPSGSVAGHVGGLLPSTRERERAARGHPPRRPGRGARVPAERSSRAWTRLESVARSSRSARRSAKLHQRHAVKAKNATDVDDGLRRPEDPLRHEVEDAGERERARHRAGDRLAVPLAQDVILVALAEAEAMVRRGSEEEDERDGRADERRVVDVAAPPRQLVEVAA